MRILGPYRIRAGRARHLFCRRLQEGEFPARSAGDPLLGDDRRGRLGIGPSSGAGAADEERYLFHACVSRPTEHLYSQLAERPTTRRTARARSPFVDEILDLLGPDSETAAKLLITRIGLERVVFARHEAPTVHELARAEALAGPRVEESKPGPLAVPAVLAELGDRDLLSATSSSAGSSARIGGSSSTS